MRTRIDYDRGVIQVRSEQLTPTGFRLRQRPSKWKPDSTYIPEGRLWPTIVQVAASGEAVDGTTVEDLLGREIVVRIEKVGVRSWTVNQEELELTEVVVTWWSDPRQPPSQWRYHVADDGSIPLIQSLDGSEVRHQYKLVGFETVRRSFPDAPGHRRRALDGLDTE